MATDRPSNSSSIEFADHILSVYDEHEKKFMQITRLSKDRFINSQWAQRRKEALERLSIYENYVNKAVTELKNKFDQTPDKDLEWKDVKAKYANLVTRRYDFELAETFFNSVTRKLFNIIGVNETIEFSIADFSAPLLEDRFCPVCDPFFPEQRIDSIYHMVDQILTPYAMTFSFVDITRDIGLVVQKITDHLEHYIGDRRVRHIEMIKSIFYRGMAAYLVGRMRTAEGLIPIVISLLHSRAGVYVDAVLLTEAEVSILFSFTRSYFHVDVDNTLEMVNFLKTIMPFKRLSEIYTSLGFYKHGKAELYRELTRCLVQTEGQFEIAAGEKGMVMFVFTFPAFDVVFKMIKDKFDRPKQTTAMDVKNKYELVFRHDRAGRLVDAQEFRHFKFDKKRFSKSLLDQLVSSAGSNVIVNHESVVIKHLYVERRLTPLDVYLKTANPRQAQKAILDYGQSIKDLAHSNIFPGDLFLKNFGVTRHGRVVFYDYDELCLLLECRFRKIPKARHFEDDFSAEPWFHVDANDVFPEEFETFLKIPDEYKTQFVESHGNLFEAAYWKFIQNRLENKEVLHVFPYEEKSRLKYKLK